MRARYGSEVLGLTVGKAHLLAAQRIAARPGNAGVSRNACAGRTCKQITHLLRRCVSNGVLRRGTVLCQQSTPLLKAGDKQIRNSTIIQRRCRITMYHHSSASPVWVSCWTEPPTPKCRRPLVDPGMGRFTTSAIASRKTLSLSLKCTFRELRNKNTSFAVLVSQLYPNILVL